MTSHQSPVSTLPLNSTKPVDSSWYAHPPTPDSILTPLAAPPLPSIPFDLLPPPLQSHSPDLGYGLSSFARLLNQDGGEPATDEQRATPASVAREGWVQAAAGASRGGKVVEPTMGYFVGDKRNVAGPRARAILPKVS